MKAFPQKVGNEYQVEHCMDLRDYFAAKALPSCISAWIDSQDKCNEAVYFAIEHETNDAQIVAEDAYGIADAMMKAREQ